MTERRVEYMSLDSVPGATRNPKRHSGDIPVSIRRFGFTEPLLLDERTGKLVAGHGRLEAVRQLRAGKEEPPPGVRVKKGHWEVPVVRGWSSRSDTEADAYLLASNRLTEVGGWESDGLAELLKELEGAHALEGLGWSDDELKKLIATYDAASPVGVEFDEFDENTANDVKFAECPSCHHRFPL